jgi:protoheme IX farnesyltransferase
MVLVTTILGFYLGGNVISSFRLLVVTLLGTGLCAGGAGALNHYLERDADMQMERTKNRPLPSGIIQPSQEFSVYTIQKIPLTEMMLFVY